MIKTTPDMMLSRSVFRSRRGGAPNITPWVRPTDWPEIIAPLPTEQRFVGLHTVFPNDDNFVALSASGDYTVDWGDGLVQNFAAGAVAERTFDFNDAGLSAATSRGYRCTVISVTPQAGHDLTALDLHLRHSQPELGQYQSGFLDIALAGPLLTQLHIGTQASGIMWENPIVFGNLERINVVRCNVANWSFAFLGCTKLQSVVSIDTAAGTNFAGVFASCNSLQTVPLFNTAAGADFAGMFSDCSSLQTVPLFNTAAGTNFAGMFSRCSSLQTVPLFNTVS